MSLQQGLAGQFTRAAGFLAYYEICYKILREGYTVIKDPEGRIGPYAFRGNQWVGFDDVEMITFKSEYVRKMGLGGGMIWALDLDDFNNRCGEGRHPLLTAIKDVLSVPKGQYPGITDGAGDDTQVGYPDGGGVGPGPGPVPGGVPGPGVGPGPAGGPGPVGGDDDEFAVIEAGDGRFFSSLFLGTMVNEHFL